MRTGTMMTAAAVVLAGLCVCPTHAQTARSSALTCGIRQYASHSDDSESPFGKGDLSYFLAYEYHEARAYWQVGVSYTPHATATSMVTNVESVTTPQVRLIFEEGMLIMGIGVLKHYIQQGDANHWSDLYWELEAGFQTSASASLGIRAVAYYTFREWGDIGDFDTSQLELGLEVSYRF